MSAPRGTKRSDRVFGWLLRAYPAAFRARHGRDIAADWALLWAEGRRFGAVRTGAAGARIARDWIRSVARERLADRSRRGRHTRPGFGATRQAVRQLSTAPGFAALVVVVLALGLGPAIAAYAVADGLLFRPIPGVRGAEELAWVWHGTPTEFGVRVDFVSYPNLHDILPRLETLEGLAGAQGGAAWIEDEAGLAEPVRSRFVTPSYFELLRLRPAAGRFFVATDDEHVQGAPPVLVASHRLAVARFGSAAAAVGETLELNEREFTVIGVAPPGFLGLNRQQELDLWIPGALQNWWRGNDRDIRSDRDGAGFYEFVARLAPGATWDQARAELSALNAWLAETWPEENASYDESDFHVYPGVGLGPLVRERLARSVWLIAAIALCVLAVALANAAGLLLNRGIEQRGRVAIQKALGAPAGRLVRQSIGEGLLLGLCGAVAGLALAAAFLRVFEGVRLENSYVMLEGARIDWRAMLFAVIASALVATVAASLATLDAARVDPARWLASAGRTSSRRTRRWQLALGVTQVAVTVPLLVGALLFTQSLRTVLLADLGFSPEGVSVLSFTPAPPGSSQPVEEMRALAQAAARGRGVEAAAVATGWPPLGSTLSTPALAVGDDRDAARDDFQEMAVTDGYFELLGVPVLRGRSFTAREAWVTERGAFDTIVVNAAAATALFGSIDDALGAEVQFPIRSREGRVYRVIGVVGNLAAGELAAPPPPMIFTPLDEWGIRMNASVLVRSTAGTQELLESVAASMVAAGLESRKPLRRVVRLEDALAEQRSEPRLLVTLFGVLAAIGLVLGVVGLSGAAVRAVLARAREIGIRQAIGADRAAILRDVVGRIAGAVLLGALGGCALSLAGLRWVGSRLHGTGGEDPRVWLLAAVVLCVAAGLAAVLPARRAVRIEPVEALRSDP